jgi:hypothetical protein
MNFEEWLAEVPLSITRDALWQMKVYQVSLFLGDLGMRIKKLGRFANQ